MSRRSLLLTMLPVLVRYVYDDDTETELLVKFPYDGSIFTMFAPDGYAPG
jgi:hypothetical protein